MSLNQELAQLFTTLAAVTEIRGDNPFKALAFHKVSRVLKDMTLDIRDAHERGTLDQIEGIGPSSRKIISEYLTTGRSVELDQMLQTVPAGLLPLLNIPGLGPKTIALFWHERGITNLEQLVQAIDTGKLAGLRGVGEKKIASIKQGIELASRANQRMGLPEAEPIARALASRLEQMKQVKRVAIAGSLRRRRETVGDVDLVCSAKPEDGEAVAKAFVGFPEVERVLGQGSTKASVVTAGGLQVDLRIIPDAHFGAALLYFTGSKEHSVRIRTLTQDKKMTLNEWGLYKGVAFGEPGGGKKEVGKAPEDKPVASKTEEDIYAALGMAYIEPELREDRGEVEAALKDTLPKLIALEDIRGDLHTHTNASDGLVSIEEMAEAAKARGYEYLAITDHSKSQSIANGLSAERLLQHAAAIRKANDKLKGIALLAGVEVDILSDGHLDYEDAVLAELDFIVASPHVALKQEESKATERLLRAIDNPYVNVIGHPTGRLINRREGLSLDWERIFRAAHTSGTALEINAGWPRWDLNDVQARSAIQSGVLLSINTDAHHPDSFADMAWGLGVARRAWAEKKHVINCFTIAQLRAWVKQKRK